MGILCDQAHQRKPWLLCENDTIYVSVFLYMCSMFKRVHLLMYPWLLATLVIGKLDHASLTMKYLN